MRPGAFPLPRPCRSRDPRGGGRRHHCRHHLRQLMAGASLLARISQWPATGVHLSVPGDASLANRDRVAAATRSTSRSSTSTSAAQPRPPSTAKSRRSWGRRAAASSSILLRPGRSIVPPSLSPYLIQPKRGEHAPYHSCLVAVKKIGISSTSWLCILA